MVSVQVASLKEKTMYNADLLLNKNFVILPAGIVINQEFLELLRTWGYKELLCNDSNTPNTVDVSSNKQMPSTANRKKNELKEDYLQNIYDSIQNTEVAFTSIDEEERINAVLNVYIEYTNYIDHVYTYYATHKKINKKELADAMERLINFMSVYKKYTLIAGETRKTIDKPFLVTHSMRSTILALIIGQQLNMENDKLRDLAIACILHEIGMLTIPPQLYMTDKHLSKRELTQINTHTIEGYNILKSFDFPLSIQLGALEHHEKENGNGYPRHMTGEKISMFAKIISVACSFEAITAPRNYKSERTAFDAMMELLKNQNAQYDPTVIKALVTGVSLYPIGTYVFLANGKVGQVIDIQPESLRTPIVQLLTEKDQDRNPITIQTDEGKNKISRVLSIKEVDDILKTLNKN